MPSRAHIPVTTYLQPFKFRIGLMIGLSALAGVMITPGPAPAPGRLLVFFLAVVIASAAAGAFNQAVECDIDRLMARTARRVFASGRLHPRGWATATCALVIGACVVAGYAANAVAALYVFLGAFTYAVVYTLWLKRRTAWNIVIGGLAGSFAVLAGAAAVDPGLPSPLALAFALVLFLWTPPHFWSLAIAYRGQYAAAGVPMLPVVAGDAQAARAVLSSACLLVLASLLPARLGLGVVYALGAAGAGAALLASSVRLALRPGARTAMTNFRVSLVYLPALFVAVALARA